MSKAEPEKIVIVTGDVTMDWNLARTRRTKFGQLFWSAEDRTHACWQRGGSALLADIIEAVAVELAPQGIACSVRQPNTPRRPEEVYPGDARYHHAYAIWSQMEHEKGFAWRVDEFLGLNRASDDSVQGWQKVVNDSHRPALIVLDDANLGFRQNPELWPSAISKPPKQSPWILYKMSKPVAGGPLWESLHRDHAKRLILVTTVNDLRLTEIQISRELSWELTAQDTFWELVHNPCINALSHCAHVVISFGPAGAILLSREEGISRCYLFFDPYVIEGMWERGYPGGMIGYTSCLTAGIARQLMLSPEKPDIAQGIQSGLAAMRALHLEGYGAPDTGQKVIFPIKLVTATLAKGTGQFPIVEVRDPLRLLQRGDDSQTAASTDGWWTILKEKYTGSLDDVAEFIVLEGPENALRDIPLGQFGALLTVDRREIENYRSVRTLIYEYCQQGQQKRPLSIAVFGAPGSGKSFGISEIARSIMPEQVEVREFNLSQFGAPEALIAAFHQVRDISLSGKTPLVFWDEFDSAMGGMPLGWLRYFLSPMQDGRFQEGQISHPIGRSIFVFAGGTSTSMAAFGQSNPESFRAAKGPDFVSRLKGYANILGPNPLKGDDPYFIIRRAILLRSILKKNAPQLFNRHLLNIDRGLLRALLKTREYRHGVRSIESLIAMSQLTGKSTFERSSLSVESQLDLHVDGLDFLALVQQIELDSYTLEKLAEAAHEMYREGLKARGRTTNAATVPYTDLSEELKEQNRQNVRDIPNKLSVAGYVMVPARSNEPPFNFPGDAMERLAENEHERWMQAKCAFGWQYAPITDASKKQSSALLPWDKLPEEEKEKDRDLVRGIPDILARAGYAIIKVRA